GGTADRNRSHWSTSKTPSYTKSVSWQHHLLSDRNIKVIVHQLGTTDLTSAAGKLLLSMLAAVAEMERDLLIERTQAGLSRAKAEGKKLGRPSKIAAEARRAIVAKKNNGVSVSALAREYGVSRATITAIFD
ncbi:recombinase family protein, partial [Escherichia coli]|uniref:recombinase family protein n=7 Tax=Enterobacterales TaxID=91347 RepID=UPI002022C46F